MLRHCSRGLALLALVPCLALAQNPLKLAPKPTTTAITAADLMTRLYVFADDSMQGREVGTEGHLRGARYLAGELTRLGLTPAGDSGTFYQDFVLDVTAPDPATTVKVGSAALTSGTDFIIFPAIGLPGIGKPFSAENVPVIYGGKIGDATLLSPEAAAGKLVLFAPADGPGGWQFWGRFGPPQYQKYASAAGLMIAALDVVPGDLAGYLGSTQVGMHEESGQPDPTIALMYLTTAAAEKMFGGPLNGLMAGAEGPAVTAMGGSVKGASPIPGRNVVAIIPGTDPVLQHQYVAVGAHNDHEGIRRPVEHDSLRAFNTVVRPGGAEDGGKQATAEQLPIVQARLDSLRALRGARIDSIMNGADDDGSGSMAVLELAEYFKANPVRRSIVLVWHAGEEKGLFGSGWFTDHPTVSRDSIVAQINLDMIGRGSPADIPGGGPGYIQLIGSRRLSTQLGDLVEAVNTTGKHGFSFDYQFDANGHPAQYYCRSDHYMYARYGIPVVFFSTGSHPDYHHVTDEPQYIGYEKYARVTSFVRDVARTVANLDARPLVDHAKPDPKGQCKQ
ncbi:MAG: M28 family peptidase [Gemmatimonadota bacterium]